MFPDDNIIVIVIYAASVISKEVRGWLLYRTQTKNAEEKPPHIVWESYIYFTNKYIHRNKLSVTVTPK